MKRRLTAILAGTGLLAIIIGLPALLIATANVAAPHHGWTPAGLWQALLAPDDGTLLVTIVKLAGWISWAILTTTIALEVASRARRLPVPQLRGMAWPTGRFLFWTFVQAAGSLIGVGMMIRAYQVADAGRVAILEYVILPASAFWTWALWGETLGPLAVAGILLIFAAGLIIALRGRPPGPR
mgnify:CR=1 FL=1